MPSPDPEKRAGHVAAFRARQTPAYFRWLHRRRKLRFEDAESFRRAIEESLVAENGVAAMRILERALEDADARAREVGNRFNHTFDAPYWDEKLDGALDGE